jgi:MFS family permease
MPEPSRAEAILATPNVSNCAAQPLRVEAPRGESFQRIHLGVRRGLKFFAPMEASSTQPIAGREPAADQAQMSAAIRAVVLLMAYESYSLSIVGISSPWIARSFHLDQAALARLFALISTSALGALALSRLADLVGRRRIMLVAMAVTPLCAAGAALARNPIVFALFEVGLFAMVGGAVSCATVMMAEEMPVERRARGQAYAGFAATVGGCIGYFIIPLLVKKHLSWRWMFAPSVVGVLMLPMVAAMLPTSARWNRAASSGSVARSNLWGVFAPLYRRRALALLACAALDTVAGTAVNTWLYFQAVSITGLAPSTASAIVVFGSAIGTLGFPLGAWTAERFGRVPTVVQMGIMTWLGAIWFYWGPPRGFLFPTLWLGLGYAWFRISSAAMTVGANAATTELFPTQLRGTIIGWQLFNVAVFSIVAQSAIAALAAPMGGLSRVIGWLALLGIPSALIFGAFIDETRGLDLETAAMELDDAEPDRAAEHQRGSR